MRKVGLHKVGIIPSGMIDPLFPFLAGIGEVEII